MSIVEHALEKGRAAQRSRQGQAAQGQPAERRGASGGVARAGQAAVIDSALRIRPLQMPLDAALCRERRVVLHDSAEKDAATVAAYRMLRTRLLHRMRAKHWTTIAVTSADQNDGKTLTALNLAISMAREKSREIVLLDLDMRNPSVFRTLGIRPTVELSKYLETGEGARELFVSACSDNLLIAGSLSPTEDASELLASPSFEDLLNVVKKGTVDPILLLDLPPVLLTDDALVVAPKIDAFLFVTSEGSTNRADLAKALNMLAEFPIAGVALNRAVGRTPAYDYDYARSGEEMQS